MLIGIALVGGLVLGILAGRISVPLDLLVAFVAIPVIAIVCFRGFARRDPLGCLSILVPAWIATLLAIPLPHPAGSLLDIAAVGWIGLFVFFPRHVWPTWSRLVLRRTT